MIQWKGGLENDRRNYFMINFHESMGRGRDPTRESAVRLSSVARHITSRWQKYVYVADQCFKPSISGLRWGVTSAYIPDIIMLISVMGRGLVSIYLISVCGFQSTDPSAFIVICSYHHNLIFD